MFAAYLIIGIILTILGLVSVIYFAQLLKIGDKCTTISALTQSLNTFLIGFSYFYCAMLLVPQTSEETNNSLENGTSVVNNSQPNDFLSNYQNLVKHVLKLEPRSMNKTEEMGDCFSEVFMEDSMFLYSFLHSVIALLINGLRTTKSEEKSEKLGKYQAAIESLLTFLLPVVAIGVLYFIMGQNLPEQDFDNIFNIIRKPINVSNAEKRQEIGDVIRNIYSIINATKSQTPSVTPDSVFYLATRMPKMAEMCPNFDNLHRIYTLLVFLLYFATILYMKVLETQLKTYNVGGAKQVLISLTAFAILWVFSIFELFSRNFFFDNEKANKLLTDIFLSLGNLNQFNIVAWNWFAAKEMVKKYITVQPKV